MENKEKTEGKKLEEELFNKKSQDGIKPQKKKRK